MNNNKAYKVSRCAHVSHTHLTAAQTLDSDPSNMS